MKIYDHIITKILDRCKLNIHHNNIKKINSDINIFFKNCIVKGNKPKMKIYKPFNYRYLNIMKSDHLLLNDIKIDYILA